MVYNYGLLQAEGALREPVLYLSLFLKTHRHTHYDLLQQVRKSGDWEAARTINTGRSDARAANPVSLPFRRRRAPEA